MFMVSKLVRKCLSFQVTKEIKNEKNSEVPFSTIKQERTISAQYWLQFRVQNTLTLLGKNQLEKAFLEGHFVNV